MICFRLVLILNGLTLFFRSEFRSLHWPSSFALSLFTSSNSRLISRVLTNQRLNFYPHFYWEVTWSSIFQVLAKLLSVFPLLPCPQTRRGQSCSSIAENDFGTFDEFNLLFYFYVFSKAGCKGKSKVQPESLLGVRWQQRSSGELPRFSFPASTWSPCYLSTPSHWRPEHRTTIFKIRKTLDIYLQVPVVSGLILDCRFQVLNLPGTWWK